MRIIKVLILHIILCLPALGLQAQDFDDFSNNRNNEFGDGTVVDANGQVRSTWGRDTSKVDKSVPTEYHQWRIEPLFGTRLPEEYNDTLPHLFQNSNFTEGLLGEYNILGNLGSPRMPRNALDRKPLSNMIFVDQFSYVHTEPDKILFTNTKSPLTNLQYHKCGTDQNGQDRFRAYFASNINKIAGFGFKFDYLYGRGYYNEQANSQFIGNLFGYYLGEHYDMHIFGGYEHMKMGENGGIEDDVYITDPESLGRSIRSRDIPTVLSNVWNRNDVQTYYLNHRYNIGIYHELEVPDSLKPIMPDELTLMQQYLRSDSLIAVINADSTERRTLVIDSLKTVWQDSQPVPQEFIPVTSIFHTMRLQYMDHENYSRGSIPDGYFSHEPYYRSNYTSDFSDNTTALSLRNNVGIQLREGFNKWAKAGINLFAAHEFQRYRMPSIETTDSLDFFDTYTKNHFIVGGEILKQQGRLLHYNAGAEFWVLGQHAGDFKVHGNADLNFRLGRDTVHLVAKASFENMLPSFYFDHYHSQTHWWDNDLGRETRTHIEGRLSIDRTRTSLRFGFQNISNYTYFAGLLTPSYDTDGVTVKSYAHDVEVRQQSGSIQVMSATARQDLKFGFFHWDNEVTWQHSSNQDVLPLPTITLYTNPYVVFHVAKILRCELGVDLRFFTKYYAPDYAPFLNQFVTQDATQERVEIGNYPILNIYANFVIKRVRGYINYTRLDGSKKAFWAPHYPVDPAGIHFGISWNFYD